MRYKILCKFESGRSIPYTVEVSNHDEGFSYMFQVSYIFEAHYIGLFRKILKSHSESNLLLFQHLSVGNFIGVCETIGDMDREMPSTMFVNQCVADSDERNELSRYLLP